MPPHFHAYYNEYEILVDITNYRVMYGFFPPKALGLVMEWMALHKTELLQNWELAFNRKHTFKIEPLK